MDSDQWRGVFANKIWTLKQTDDSILYHAIPESQTVSEEHELLIDYFQLKVKLKDLFMTWCQADVHFDTVAKSYAGVRVLRQDPVENLFSFLCTSNNNIQRITSMVEKLCTLYGKEIGQVDGQTYYGFPQAEDMMSDLVEEQLKKHKFGYRAGYVAKTAQQIVDHGGGVWLHDLRNRPYNDARKKLITLTGVGPKVADCVCLMSLDKTEAVPIDTHMFQIAARSYLPSLKMYKTLTDKAYVQIGNHFRSLFGCHAGWAHSVLFTSDLPKFQKLLEPLETKNQPKTCSSFKSSPPQTKRHKSSR